MSHVLGLNKLRYTLHRFDDPRASPSDIHAPFLCCSVMYYRIQPIALLRHKNFFSQAALSFIWIVTLIHLVFSFYPLALNVLLDLRD